MVDYKDDEVLRKSFNALAIETFAKGLDFEPWYQEGYWNNRYICYSFVDDNQVVSNVSANRMVICEDGVLKEAIQIGTVMTHPDYRKRGLASKLIHRVLEDLDLLKKISKGRTPISQTFGVTNDEHLIMFYCTKFMEILNIIVEDEVSQVSFHFTPDIVEDSLIKETLVTEDSTLLVKPHEKTDKSIQYPMFSHA